jgi:hypothetical protein
VRLALPLVTLGAALLALLAAAPAAGAREVGGCRVPDSATVQAVGGRLVVWTTTRVDPVWEDEFTRVVACRRASGARVLVTETLVELQWSERPYAFRVAGDHVAWAQAETGRRFGLLVNVFDARRRRKEHSYVATWHPTAGGELSRIESLVLTRSGAVAWVIRHVHEFQYQPGTPRVPVGVRALDGDGSRLLDKGEGIDPSSLHLEGGLVRWTNAGEARSAPLR